MSVSGTSRRSFTASAAGIAAGIFATSLFGTTAFAQSASPEGGVQPVGFVSMRIRTVASAGQREAVDELVLNDFVPDVEALNGFQGFVLGDVIDAPEKSLSILVLDEESQQAAFDDLASEFIERISDEVETVDTVQWSGDLLITGGQKEAKATPAVASATPEAGAMTSGHVAVRVHTSLPGTDPHDFVSRATSDFLPIVEGLEGFRGYLWFPVESGFAAVTLYDSEESAEASNEAAREWAAEFLTKYTDGNPEIINANVIYANLSVLG